MPELPEVETIVRTIAPALCGCRVVDVACGWRRTLSPPLDRTRVLVVGRIIRSVGRRGKYAVISLVDERGEVTMLIHLRMSGRLTVDPGDAPRDRHLRFRMTLSDGRELRFADARKFGRIVVTDDPAQVLDRLGDEPLAPEFTPERLGKIVGRRRRMLKPLLLDQTVIAGMGNIYTDEALHRARLHPRRCGATLRSGEVRRLHAAIRLALRRGITLNGASIDWVYPGGLMQNQFRVYGRDGKPCPRCRTVIRRIVVGQRGTFLCPRCQPERC